MAGHTSVRLFKYPKIMRNKLIVLFLGLITLSLIESCQESVALSSNNNREPEIAVPAANPEMLAVLYQRTAAEYRALCYQAFNTAQYQLELRLKEKHGMKKYSVIVDIDETMLDNSPYEANCILNELIYPEGWDEWVNSASAKAVPGALEFLRFAETRGIEVFYVSNREQKYFDKTMLNLQNLQFPFARPDHLMLKSGEGSKADRRGRISNSTDIVMLIGDNLIDFSEMFENQPVQTRNELTDRFRLKFGTEFIVLPNAMYGDWLNAVYYYDKMLDDEGKAEKQRSALKAN